MEIAEKSSMATMNFDVFNSILAEIVTSLLTCDEASFEQQLQLFKVCFAMPAAKAPFPRQQTGADQQANGRGV